MNQQQATNQIRTLFQSSFSRENYILFLRNLLNDFESKHSHYSGNTVPDAFRQHINQYWRVGKYTDPGNLDLDLYVVEVKSLSKLDRARTSLRNFAVRTMKTFGGKDYALIAFYAKEDQGQDWRFSFIKIEHGARIDTNTGKVKSTEELTPAKRYSFLVGEHENSHTAQAQLVSLLAMDYANPTIDEIEQAFSIERVTKEFFEQYKDLFVRLSELLEQDPHFKDANKDKARQQTAKFAKKLLGQIVFLYFLQKKGWLGVPEGQDWGKGERRFLQKLNEQANAEKSNYYTEKLQYLFYEALANDRKDQYDPSYYQRFKCKIPFLNGGLFEADYDWQKVMVQIPNSIFSNTEKTKSGDTGTGILDVFDRYNFTIKEDEPLEKEVAVDPEMLGKVFENMLEITERKSKGAFYTPREIVHYMCQESLIHYLVGEVGAATETEISKDELEILVHKGHLAIENDHRVQSTGRETEAYKYILPQAIRENAELLNSKLSDIKICDPAIGSGAFPVGMLHEIVNARQALTPYLSKELQLRPYELKKHAIANSIYGVDIDTSAIDIARLRLWLSLVVDEDDYSSIDALPNLDYKIMQGNSLLEEYEGVPLFNDAFIAGPDSSVEREKAKLKVEQAAAQAAFFKAREACDSVAETSIEKKLKEVHSSLKRIDREERKLAKKSAEQSEGLFDLISEARKKSNLLEKLHKDFFDISSPVEKRNLRDRITQLEWDLIEATLKEQGRLNALEKLKPIRESGEKPFFLWKLNFSEVFKDNGGFDVVIGNPPYFNIDTFGANSQIQSILKKRYEVYMDKSDILYYFFEKAIKLSKSTVTFITSNAFLHAQKAARLRNFMLSNSCISRIVNFEKFMIFDDAAITTAVTILDKRCDQTKYLNCLGDDYKKDEIGHDLRQLHNYQDISFSTDKPFALVDERTSSLIDRIDESTSPLGDLYKIGSGMQTGSNKVYISKKFPETFPRSCIKPRITGSIIRKYVNYEPNEEVLYLEDYSDFKNLPDEVKSYLNSNKEVLSNRADKKRRATSCWWNFTFPMHRELYNLRKIWTSYRGSQNAFSLDDTHGEYIGLTNTTVIFETNSSINFEYTLAILNSELLTFRYRSIGKQTGGGLYEYFENGVSKLPIKIGTGENQRTLGLLVGFAITLKQNVNVSSLVDAFIEQLINGLVYELYFEAEIKAAGKELFLHVGDLQQITGDMSEEAKLAVIQTEFDRLYDPNHAVRNHLETLDSVEEVRMIRKALKG